VSEDLVNVLDQAAEEHDLSRSELCRNLLWEAAGEGEVFDALPLEAKRSIWQREAKPDQHRAWFRSNVKDRLTKCFNNDLTPEEMRLDMSGRIKEAEEYDRAEWLADAFDAYERACESGDYSELQSHFARADEDNQVTPGDEVEDTDDQVQLVTRAESWTCLECQARYAPAPDAGAGALRSKPSTCRGCGHDRFRAEGTTHEETGVAVDGGHNDD
jgi:hypothetical protein